MIEEESNFLEFLNYQIIQKNKFEHVIRKIPIFKSMIQERHETIVKMIDRFEDARRREVYSILVEEFNNISKRL